MFTCIKNIFYKYMKKRGKMTGQDENKLFLPLCPLILYRPLNIGTKLRGST